MKTLADWNKEREAHWTRNTAPRPNGIACPECGAELWDTSPAVELLSCPPQKNVACAKCGWRGTRVS